MIRLNIDYYIEHENPPPKEFIDGMETMLLNDYLFLPNNSATRETIKRDITGYIKEHWPLYPLGSLVVDSLGAYDVNITVRMQDQIDDDEAVSDEDLINYECDYYIDMNEMMTEVIAQELAQAADQEFLKTLMAEQPEVIPSADDVMFSPVTVTE